MRGRRESGFTLIELLVATALVGLVAVSCLGLASQAEGEARRAEIEQAAFERRAFAVMRLRAAVARASSASMSPRAVILQGPSGRSAWCVQDDAPILAEAASACETGSLRVESRGRGTLVVLATSRGVERMLVGGGSR